MRVKIRTASPDDAKAISKLIRDELQTPVSASDTASWLSQLCVNSRHKIFVAAVDDVVVGFLHACEYDSMLLTAPMKTVFAMAVGASYRRIGIGKALLHRAECWAFEQGAGGVRMDGGVPAKEAEKFFTACGYAGTPFTKEFEKIR